jgi:bifunctional non-homologous end joining protein LigD
VDVFTLDFGKSKRSGLTLLDYKRNHRAAVAVAAYSARAHPGGTVSIPIGWSELKVAWHSDHFTVRSALKRLEKLQADPWQHVWSCEQRLVWTTSRSAL